VGQEIEMGRSTRVKSFRFFHRGSAAATWAQDKDWSGWNDTGVATRSKKNVVNQPQ
jgi:hypothetical protein